jgi:hypothetical protein
LSNGLGLCPYCSAKFRALLAQDPIGSLDYPGWTKPQAIQHFHFNLSQPGHIISILTDSGYRSFEPGQGDCPILLRPSSVFMPNLPVLWQMVRFANRPRTPSVQSHCLATFNPCVLIGVCMTNDGPDAISGCPVRMSGRIVFRTHSPDFTMSYPFGPFYGLETEPGQSAR